MGKRFLAWVPAFVSVLVCALAVGGFFVVRQSVASQESTDLERYASQLALVLQVAVQQIPAELKPLGVTAQATNDSPAQFALQAKAVTSNPAQSVALVKAEGTNYVVELAAGPSLRAGQVLPAALTSLASKAGATTVASPVLRLSGQSVVAFAIGPPFSSPGQAVVETSIFRPEVAAKDESGPYKQLNVALYAAPVAAPGELVASTTGTRPLARPVATAFLTIGTRRWLALVGAKDPLLGAALRDSQWLVLGAGLLLAILAGVSTEMLARRRAYAEALAEERTAELVASQAELVRAERLAGIGELATVVGHELRNPLGAATNALFLARQRLGKDSDPKVDVHLSMIESQMQRAVSLCEDLTAYARQREPQLEDLDLGNLIDETLAVTPPPPGTEVSVDTDSIHLQGDASMLLRVLSNVVTNAYQAMPEGGSLRIGARVSGVSCVITLEDSGPGIAPEVVTHLFEPFFTTKNEGTGLGLPIVRGIVEAHHGSISMENSPRGGALVTIQFPCVSDTDHRRKAAGAGTGASNRVSRV